MDVDLFHVAIAQDIREPLDDVAPQLQIDRQIGILMGLVDPGADQEVDHVVATHQLGQTPGRIEMGLLAVLQIAGGATQCEDTFRDQICPLHMRRRRQISGGGKVDCERAMKFTGDDFSRGSARDHPGPAEVAEDPGALGVAALIERRSGEEQHPSRLPKIKTGGGNIVGGAQFRFEPPQGAACTVEHLGGMEVTTCLLHPDTAAEDLRRLDEAVREGFRCTPCASCYRVGAVIVLPDGRAFRGYTHETSPTHHAEQEAVRKALDAGADLRGAAIYSSMEPCSDRRSEPESCTQLILRYGFARVVFAAYEPSCFVCCRGARMLREAGVDVRVYPEMAGGVREANAHVWR